jgi:spore coat protein CotH
MLQSTMKRERPTARPGTDRHRGLDPRRWVRGLGSTALLMAFACASATGWPEVDDHDPSEPLFDAERLLHVELELDPEHWNELRSQGYTMEGLFRAMAPDCLAEPITEPRPYLTYPADLWLDGELIEEVGLRKKGLIGSQSSTRPSLKIEFDAYRPGRRHLGLSRLTLNNNRQDRAYVQQCMAYGTFADSGAPAPRCNFARVWVNGEDLGLYSNIESVKRPFLLRRFGNDDGNLYEGTLSDFRPGWIGSFQRKNNDQEPDRGDLEAVSEALAGPDHALIPSLEALLDLEAFVNHWAVESLVGHWDGYSGNANNFFVYADPDNRGRFEFIPWGADATFRPAQDWGSGGALPASVQANGYLAYRLYHHPQGRQRYLERMRWLAEEVWHRDALHRRLDAMLATIGTDASDAFMADLERETGSVRDFIDRREDDVMEEVEAGGAEWPLPPRGDPCERQLGSVGGNFTAAWVELQEASPLQDGDGLLDFTSPHLPPPSQVGASAGWGSLGDWHGQSLVILAAAYPDGTVFLPVIELASAPDTDGRRSFDWQQARAFLYFLSPQQPQNLQLVGFLESGYVEFMRAEPWPGGTLEAEFSGQIRLYGFQ